MIRAIPATVAGLCVVGALTACSSGAEHPGQASETTTTSGPAPASAAGASFDCAKADGQAQKLVCADPELAALDRQVADEYQKALGRPGADKDALAGTQNGWAAGRDDCWQNDDIRGCLLDAYRTRIFELRRTDGTVPEPPVVSYDCPTDKAFTVQFYDGFDPKVAVLKWGEDSAVTFAERSGSGAKYGRRNVEFWEHQGEVKVNFFGNEFTCKTT